MFAGTSLCDVSHPGLHYSGGRQRGGCMADYVILTLNVASRNLVPTAKSFY